MKALSHPKSPDELLCVFFFLDKLKLNIFTFIVFFSYFILFISDLQDLACHCNN